MVHPPTPYRNAWSKQNEASPLPHYIRHLPDLPILSAYRDHSPPFVSKVHYKPRGSKLQGLRFQEKVLNWLPQSFLIRSPWFSYVDRSGQNFWCQPDFLIDSYDQNHILVGEIKIRFNSDAFLQLEKLYIPVLQKALCVDARLVPLAVCHSHDPEVQTPRPRHLIDHIGQIDPEAFNVLIVH
jgi:hypothetical protein